MMDKEAMLTDNELDGVTGGVIEVHYMEDTFVRTRMNDKGETYKQIVQGFTYFTVDSVKGTRSKTEFLTQRGFEQLQDAHPEYAFIESANIDQ